MNPILDVSDLADALSSSGTADGFLARLDPAGTATLARRFGGSSLDTVYGVAADASGNLLAGGMFQATADFGGGPLTALSNNGFVVKLTAAGSHVFSRRLGGTTVDSVYGVAADPSGGTLVTGSFSGSGDFGGGPLPSSGSDDLFVAKYDPGGSYVWARRGGGTGSDTGRSIAVDRFGNLVVAGHFSGSGDFGSNVLVAPALSRDALLVKYEATGSSLYARRFGGSSDDYGLAVAVAPNADILIGGEFQGSVDFGGGILNAVSQDGFILRRAP